MRCNASLPVCRASFLVVPVSMPIDRSSFPACRASFLVVPVSMPIDRSSFPACRASFLVVPVSLPIDRSSLPVCRASFLVGAVSLPIDKASLLVDRASLAFGCAPRGRRRAGRRSVHRRFLERRAAFLASRHRLRVHPFAQSGQGGDEHDEAACEVPDSTSGRSDGRAPPARRRAVRDPSGVATKERVRRANLPLRGEVQAADARDYLAGRALALVVPVVPVRSGVTR
jgi:hypothetical protein